MPSRSYPTREALHLTREHATVLLEDGARIESPGDEIIAAAGRLREAGVIGFQVCEYVKCCEPGDRADPQRNRDCTGRIVLDEGLDEDGDEIRCPKCSRPVRPYSRGKIRHRMLQVSVRQGGTMSWIRSHLEEVSNDVRDLGGNALHVGGFGSLGVIICVADADGHVDSRFNTRDYAATNPICYVTINPRAAEGRLLKDDWIRQVGLVDLVVGAVDLRKLLTEVAGSSLPATVSKADIPVYAKGHILIQPVEKPHRGRLFCVELSDDVVRVDGEIVVNPQAGPRLKLFRILWRQFVEDTSNGLPAHSFTALSFRRLLDMMEKEGHRYDDEGSLRKVINNLQSDIETAVKRKLGKPIDREDVVQTCRMTNQSDTSAGYRLNPFTVAIRPPRAR